jgi:hypothetical protein
MNRLIPRKLLALVVVAAALGSSVALADPAPPLPPRILATNCSVNARQPFGGSSAVTARASWSCDQLFSSYGVLTVILYRGKPGSGTYLASYTATVHPNTIISVTWRNCGGGSHNYFTVGKLSSFNGSASDTSSYVLLAC